MLINCYRSQFDTFWIILKHRDRGTVGGREWCLPWVGWMDGMMPIECMRP